MKNFLLMTLVFMIVVAGVAADSIPYSLTVKANFQGYSNMHNFQGSVDALPQDLVTEDGNLLGFEVQIPVQEMKTGDSARDSNMYSMFQMQEFPRIVARFSKLNLNQLQEGSEPGVPFELKIRNEVHPILANVANLKKSDGNISFDLNFAVSLKTMGLKAPKAMFGMIRVKDNVDLTTHFQFKYSRRNQLKLKLNQQIRGE